MEEGMDIQGGDAATLTQTISDTTKGGFSFSTCNTSDDGGGCINTVNCILAIGGRKHDGYHLPA